MRGASKARYGLVTMIGLCLLAGAAQARPARCFTSDDGAYPCDFRPTGSDGSFEIEARGKPTYQINVDEPGNAFGFVNLGGRNIALPGRYRTIGGPKGCWVNDETKTRICVR